MMLKSLNYIKTNTNKRYQRHKGFKLASYYCENKRNEKE